MKHFTIIMILLLSMDCMSESSVSMSDLNEANELMNEGIFHLQNQKFEKAIGVFKKAKSKNPNSPDIPNNIGFCYLSLNELDKANDYFLESINIDPNYSNALYNLGVLRQKVGENEQAKNYYLKAISSRNGYVEPHMNLGIIYTRLGDKKNAIKYFKEFIKLAPSEYSGPVEDAKKRIKELEGYKN